MDHRGEILRRVVGQLGHVHQDRLGGVQAHQQGVAVGRRLRDRVGADDTRAAGTVLDHRGMAGLAELRGDHARQDVGHAAGRKRHDDADRPRGKILRSRAPKASREHGAAQEQSPAIQHAILPLERDDQISRPILASSEYGPPPCTRK
jgi:hypothetical protein